MERIGFWSVNNSLSKFVNKICQNIKVSNISNFPYTQLMIMII